MITVILKADRALAAAWSSLTPLEGSRYEVHPDKNSVKVYAENEDAMARAVAALCGPFRFETTITNDCAVCLWHCPCCLSTLTTEPIPVMHLSMSDAACETLLVATLHTAEFKACRFAV